MPKQERTVVPDADVRSYYGRPILKEPTWKTPDVPAYLFLGGMAGSSATMAAFAELTRRPGLARAGRIAAASGALASVAALIHDLGRPSRFLNMLRVLKPTSPLSVGSWILSPFSGLATVAAASALTGKVPKLGRAAGFAAGALGPAMCTYTAVLLSDTAVPAWHEPHRELPALFAGSALSTGAGMGLLIAPLSEQAPARRMALLGSVLELAADRAVERGHGVVSEPYLEGRPGRLMRAAKGLSVAGAGLSLVGRRSRLVSALAGAAYLAGGLALRFGVFAAGKESTRDPKYVVLSQRPATEPE